MEVNKITIHDIARELELDSSTVSRALSNSNRVAKKTKKKYLKKQMNLGINLIY